MHISDRKSDHIKICLEEDIEYRNKTTLLEEVHLFHDSLPEVNVDEIDLSTQFLNHTLRAPFLISGMTGGSHDATIINKKLAALAQEFGFALGLGSQRAILRDPKLAETYQVRDVAPDILLLGNIGAVQIVNMSTNEVEDLVGIVDANALCVHLNPGQELIQPNGDRDFRGCIDGISRLVRELSIPVIVKETGNGISKITLDKIHRSGAKIVDVSGAGGTTWIGVETQRTNPMQKEIGELLWDWGIPTAVSTYFAHQRGFKTIASGGIRNAKDIAAALALGADIVGMAKPWLIAQANNEEEEFAKLLLESLKAILCLTGSQNIAELKEKPYRLGPTLSHRLRT